MDDTVTDKSVDISRAHLAAIVASSHDAIISKSTQGVILSWNAAAERMFGYTANEMIGQSIRMLIPEDRQAEEDEILACIVAGENVSNFETRRLRRDGTQIPVSVTVSPIRDDNGMIVGASKIVRNISNRLTILAELQESEERFRTLADNIAQLVWMAEKDGYIFWYNQRWYDYTGTTLEQMKGWGWRQVHHPDHVDRVVKRIEHCWQTGEPWEDTFPLRGADGQYRWFLSRALPIRDVSGEIVRWFGSNTEITEQKKHEEQISLLLGEVNHRSKNMLAVIQAIARQTAGPDDEDFVRRFLARLQSLAASQDLLVGTGWQGANISNLVRSQLAHFADLIGSRIRLDGPDIILTPSAAQTLGMALHELATNAGKYGALSGATGNISIKWRVLGEKGDGRFEIEWIEHDGPPVSPPKRKGFGSSVIGRMSELALGGEAEFDFRPEGLVWRLTCMDVHALEIDKSRAGNVGPPSLADDPTHARKRVLLVEDDAVIAIDLSHVLEDAGYLVIGPASSVEEALGLLQEYPCHMGVLDIRLGAQTSEPIACRLLEAGTPFMTLSGYSDDQKPAVFANIPHLPKPFRNDALLGILDTLSRNLADARMN